MRSGEEVKKEELNSMLGKLVSRRNNLFLFKFEEVCVFACSGRADAPNVLSVSNSSLSATMRLTDSPRIEVAGIGCIFSPKYNCP